MTAIHICSLAHVELTLKRSGAEWAVSLLSTSERVAALAILPEERRLHLNVSDIVAAMPGQVLAEAAHLSAYLAFLDRWDRRGPLLIHCYAGVSRSTAAAFVALCLFDPGTAETTHAQRLRAASPTATPNPHLVALADRLLDRGGRMSAAIAAIGRGAACFEGVPAVLPVGSAARVDAPGGLPA